MVGFIPLLVLYPYWIPIWIGLEDAVPSMAMICNGAAKTQLHKAVETKWNIGRFLDSDIPRLGYQKKMDDDGRCPLQAGPCRGFSTSDFDIFWHTFSYQNVEDYCTKCPSRSRGTLPLNLKSNLDADLCWNNDIRQMEKHPLVGIYNRCGWWQVILLHHPNPEGHYQKKWNENTWTTHTHIYIVLYSIFTTSLKL